VKDDVKTRCDGLTFRKAASLKSRSYDKNGQSDITPPQPTTATVQKGGISETMSYYIVWLVFQLEEYSVTLYNNNDMEASSSDSSPSELSSAQESEPTTEEQDQKPPRTRFGIIAYIVNFLRSFGKTLNPTVDFRKRNLPEHAFSTKHSTESRRKISQNPELLRRAYTHTTSGRLVRRTTRTMSGNKTYYLIRAFFPSEAEF